jgi:hypothetical protein
MSTDTTDTRSTDEALKVFFEGSPEEGIPSIAERLEVSFLSEDRKERTWARKQLVKMGRLNEGPRVRTKQAREVERKSLEVLHAKAERMLKKCEDGGLGVDVIGFWRKARDRFARQLGLGKSS